MAIPKKGSRTLTVDDVRYRWVVSVHGNTLNLVIELAEQPGQRLHAYFECRDLYVRADDGGWRFCSQKPSITPSHVRRIITSALRDGWQPAAIQAQPFIVNNAAKIAATIDAERIDSRIVDHDSKIAFIKEVAQDFLWTYMCLSLCMDGAMHDRIMNAAPDARIRIEDDNMQRMGLTFSVYRDAPTTDGRPVIALQCNEFPDIVEYYWWLCFA